MAEITQMSLGDSKRLTFKDIPILKRYIKDFDSWFYHWQFPLIYSTPNREVTFEVKEESLYLYVKNKLLFLPIPWILNLYDKDVLFAYDIDINGYNKTRLDSDLVYNNEEVMSLDGSKFKNLRNSMSRTRRERLQVRALFPEDKPAIDQLNTEWKHTQGKKYFRLLDSGYTKNAIELFDKLDYWGLILETTNGQAVGYSISGKLNDKTAVVLIGKTLTDNRYQSDALDYYTCCDNLERGFDYNNVAGSVGSKGLKKYKEKFNPIRTISNFSLKRKDKRIL